MMFTNPIILILGIILSSVTVFALPIEDLTTRDDVARRQGRYYRYFSPAGVPGTADGGTVTNSGGTIIDAAGANVDGTPGTSQQGTGGRRFRNAGSGSSGSADGGTITNSGSTVTNAAGANVGGAGGSSTTGDVTKK